MYQAYLRMYQGSYDQTPVKWNLSEYYKEWRALVGDQLLGGEAQLGFPDPLWKHNDE